MAKILRRLAPLTFLLSLLAPQAYAAMTPLALSILPPVEFPSEDVTVTGIRIDLLWGNHRNVYGFDLGLGANITQLNFGGLVQAAGLFNYNQGETTVVGVQLAGVANINSKKAGIYGVQASLYNSFAAESRIVGVSLGLIANVAPYTTVVGAQLGIYNSARDVYGFQVGIINVADHLHGLQIGLLNINKQGLFAVCPILNFGF